jgi:hypothetical protein
MILRGNILHEGGASIIYCTRIVSLYCNIQSISLFRKKNVAFWCATFFAREAAVQTFIKNYGLVPGYAKSYLLKKIKKGLKMKR